MLTSNEINAIGNVINTTWGKMSTAAGNFPQGTTVPTSLKVHLATPAGPPLELSKKQVKKERGTTDPDDNGCQLIMTFTDIVTFANNVEMQVSMKKFREIAMKACEIKLADIKKNFKSTIGRALKSSVEQSHDSVESMYSPSPSMSLIGAPALRQQIFRGYYRYTIVYRIK